MTQLEIRRRQAPLIERYKIQPESALLRLSAKGILGDNVTFRINSGEFFKEVGLHPAAGGSGIHIWSGDIFLESLAACAGVTLNAVASLLGIKLENAQVTAEGEIDFRGTMAIGENVPSGFRSLNLKFEIDADIDEQQLKELISLTEMHCAVYQTLKNTPEIKILVTDTLQTDH